MSEQLVFLGAKRTPFGGYGGSLKDLTPTELGVIASNAALEQSGVEAEKVDQTIIGNVLSSAPDSIYTARHIGLKSGVPKEKPALLINRLCGSGFEVIAQAQGLMKIQEMEVGLIGGVEAMSMAPYCSWDSRWGMKMGHRELVDSMSQALTDTYAQAPMAITAENLAEQYQITKHKIRSEKPALLTFLFFA